MRWFRWRRIPFRDQVDQEIFADFASRNGWWYTGKEHGRERPCWYTSDGVIIRFHMPGVLPVPCVEVTAEEPGVQQRAMAETEAIVRRAFRCFTVPESLKSAQGAKGEGRASALAILAATAPDYYDPDIADVVISALFSPQQVVRESALKVVSILSWPQLERALAAAALTEKDPGLANLAQSLITQTYQEPAGAFLVHPVECNSIPPESENRTAHIDQETKTSPPSAPKPSLARLIGAAGGHLDWNP